MTSETYDLKTVLRRAVSTLKKAGIEDAAADSRILAAENFGLRREDMLRSPDMLLDCVSVSAFGRSIARRAAHEPVSRILGRREFRSLDFEIGPATLDPRPDSETIVEAVLDIAADMKPDLRVLDIGTGSGCLLLSILHELPAAHGVGTDIDAGAIAYAGCNAHALGLAGRVEFRRTNWVDGVDGPFEIILSNPPYIRTGDIPGLASEVAKYDPTVALDGGKDGLDAYRALSACISPVVALAGAVVLEIGAGQEADVETIFTSTDFGLAGKRADLAGRNRAMIFGRTPRSNV